jgi:outer membrane protein assembly factor BamB
MTARISGNPAFLRKAVACLTIASTMLALAACGDRSTPPPKAAKKATDEKPAAVVMRQGDDVPFEHSWDLKLPKPVHTSWISENIPELIFFQLEDSGEIYAVDTMSGHTKFVTRPLPKPLSLPAYVARVSTPGPIVNTRINDDRLYVVSDDILFCFDAIYGQLIWRFELPFSPSSGPLAVGGEGNLRVYMGDWDGREQVSTYSIGKQFPHILWQWNTYSPSMAQAVGRDGNVYVGDDAGNMRCFHLDRELAWTFPAGSGITGSAFVRPPNVFFGTKDGVFYSLNSLSGVPRGSLYFNAPIKRQPFAFPTSDPNHVYVWTTHSSSKLGGLHAVKSMGDLIVYDETKRREVERMSKDWFIPDMTALVSSTPDHIYLMKPDSTVVHAVNRVNGKIDWAWDLNQGRKRGREVAHVTQYQDPSDLNRSIYTVDEDGQVDAFRLFGYKPKDRVAMATTLRHVVEPARNATPAKAEKAEAAPAEEKPAEEETPAE